MNTRCFYLIYGFGMAALIILNVFLQVVQPELRHALIDEGGPVESLSAAGYFMCVLLLAPLRRKCRGYPSIMFLLLVMGLRELDAQELFTTMSLTKSRFYISPEVPAAEKVIAVAFMLLLFYAVFRLLTSRLRDFTRALGRLESHATGVATAIFFLLIAKSIDGLERKLAAFGLFIGSRGKEISLCIEETMELGIPLLFLLSIAVAFRPQADTVFYGKRTGGFLTKTS
jgi:hypothetical protein